MKLIPVIDLLRGQVVHARGGRRTDYAPIRSPLCRSSAPQAVVDALLELHPFDTLYVADLDAITGRGGQHAILQDLRRRHPDLNLWVDAGLGGPADVAQFLRRGLGRPVVGSESLPAAAPPDLNAWAGDPILSLDFRGGRLLGPPELCKHPDCWPARVIVMSLDRVGCGTGPDLDRLASLRRLAPGRRWYVAGGVRGPQDLAALAEAGADGVLLATALHQGIIDATHLARYR